MLEESREAGGGVPGELQMEHQVVNRGPCDLEVNGELRGLAVRMGPSRVVGWHGNGVRSCRGAPGSVSRGRPGGRSADRVEDDQAAAREQPFWCAGEALNRADSVAQRRPPSSQSPKSARESTRAVGTRDEHAGHGATRLNVRVRASS